MYTEETELVAKRVSEIEAKNIFKRQTNGKKWKINAEGIGETGTKKFRCNQNQRKGIK